MLAAQAKGTDGNLFPHSFTLTFEESVNKCHTVGSYWYPKASITQQTSLQNIKLFA
jgi:hypothetical protein